MSVAFIECDEIRRASRLDMQACCGACHEKEALIYFVPKQEDGKTNDWTLCIEGMICCRMYHAAQAIPRDWWVKRAEELGVRRDDGRGYVYPSTPTRNTDQPRPTPLARRRAIAEDDNRRERDGGLTGFLKRNR